MIRLVSGIVFVVLGSASLCHAGDVEIVDARYERTGEGLYTFQITLRHEDEGWDHYTDKWQVLSPDRKVFGERVLLHPHVNEQPFTRSQSGIAIPEGTSEVVVRAHDTVHGWSPDEKRVRIAMPDD